MTLPIYTISSGKLQRQLADMTIVHVIEAEIQWLCEICSAPAAVADWDGVYCVGCLRKQPQER